jgi:hypothetical protein
MSIVSDAGPILYLCESEPLGSASSIHSTTPFFVTPAKRRHSLPWAMRKTTSIVNQITTTMIGSFSTSDLSLKGEVKADISRWILYGIDGYLGLDRPLR